MASHSAIESATNGFTDRGRTLKGTHTVDLAEASHRPAFQSLANSPDGLTHLDVIVANGPFGPEVLIQPRSGDHGLPGELYAQVAGAFGAPAAYDKASGEGFAWTSPSANLQEYLRTHQFGAPALPGGQRSGRHHIDMDWTVQILALGPAQSIVACQLSSDEPTGVALALSTIDRLAQVTGQSQAAGAQGGLHAFRFGFVVELALSGQLDVPPPAPVATQPPPPVATPVAAETEMLETASFESSSYENDSFANTSSFDSRSSFESSSFESSSFDSIPSPTSASDISISALGTLSVEDAELDSEALYDMSSTSWEGSGADSINAPARVAEALGRYEGKRVFVGVIPDQKKLANVQRGIDPDVDVDTICGFVDTGARANGKSGVVFTTTAMHFCGLSARLHYDYTAIESFELESTAVIINGVDGTRAKISAAGQSLPIAEAVAAATGLSV